MNAVPGSRIIALAARLVPPAQREAWRKEWEAEAAYAWRLATRKHTHGTATAALRLGSEHSAVYSTPYGRG